jgi:hypothetical protein
LFMKNLKMKWFWRFSRANPSFYNFGYKEKKFWKDVGHQHGGHMRSTEGPYV